MNKNIKKIITRKNMDELIDHLVYLVESNEILDDYVYYETLYLSKKCGYRLSFIKTENERDICIYMQNRRIHAIKMIYIDRRTNKYETLYIE